MHVWSRKEGRDRADSQRGGTGIPGQLLLRVKVASNIKGKEFSVPVASFLGLELHHPTIEHAVGTWRPGQKKKDIKKDVRYLYQCHHIPCEGKCKGKVH